MSSYEGSCKQNSSSFCRVFAVHCYIFSGFAWVQQLQGSPTYHTRSDFAVDAVSLLFNFPNKTLIDKSQRSSFWGFPISEGRRKNIMLRREKLLYNNNNDDNLALRTAQNRLRRSVRRLQVSPSSRVWAFKGGRSLKQHGGILRFGGGGLTCCQKKIQ